MKNRLRKVVNFFAFNLLFFALYLNFIHKDASGDMASSQSTSPVYTGTSPVQNAELTAHEKATVEMAKK